MKDALLLIAGALISVWTGIVTARYFEFRAAVRSMIASIVTPIPNTKAPEDHEHSHRERGAAMLEIVVVLEEHGQGRLARFVQRIGMANIENRKRVAVIVCDPRQSWFIRAEQGRYAQSLDCVRELVELQPDVIPLLLGKNLSTVVGRAVLGYNLFTEHLETGEPFAEIRARLEEEANR